MQNLGQKMEIQLPLQKNSRYNFRTNLKRTQKAMGQVRNRYGNISCLNNHHKVINENSNPQHLKNSFLSQKHLNVSINGSVFQKDSYLNNANNAFYLFNPQSIQFQQNLRKMKQAAFIQQQNIKEFALNNQNNNQSQYQNKGRKGHRNHTHHIFTLDSNVNKMINNPNHLNQSLKIKKHQSQIKQQNKSNINIIQPIQACLNNFSNNEEGHEIYGTQQQRDQPNTNNLQTNYQINSNHPDGAQQIDIHSIHLENSSMNLFHENQSAFFNNFVDNQNHLLCNINMISHNRDRHDNENYNENGFFYPDQYQNIDENSHSIFLNEHKNVFETQVDNLNFSNIHNVLNHRNEMQMINEDIGNQLDQFF